MAQRLVRRICPSCALDITPDPADIPPDFVQRSGDVFRMGKGCRECRTTGFRGRVGIYELLMMNDDIREMVMKRVNAGTIAERARKAGDLTLLRDAGFEKVRQGLTTLTEVIRATKA